MSNEVFKNDTSISLDWANVSGADQYHVQVATTPDFSGTLLVDDNALGSSAKSFTDTGSNDGKRWWRWRYSTDTGSTWSAWQDVGSYWLNTNASADVGPSAGEWVLFDPDDVSDAYTFDDYPFYTVTPEAVYRVKERNRKGTLLSEYITTKARIHMDFSESLYMAIEQMREFLRFDAEVKTFFLGVYKSNHTDTVPHIWKVQFSESPSLTMLAAGREDVFVGRVEFEEV